MESRFPESSPVKVKLLQGAIYDKDTKVWRLLLDHEAEIKRYFFELGVSVVADISEGYAFLEQLNVDDDPGMPRLLRRRPFTFEMTMLLVLLREELLRFDATPSAAMTLPTVKHDWLVEQMAAFVPEKNNRVKRQNAIDQMIRTAVNIGVLRVADAEEEHYEIMRIVKAKLPEEKLAEIRDRLKAAAQTKTEGDADGNPTAD